MDQIFSVVEPEIWTKKQGGSSSLTLVPDDDADEGLDRRNFSLSSSGGASDCGGGGIAHNNQSLATASTLRYPRRATVATPQYNYGWTQSQPRQLLHRNSIASLSWSTVASSPVDDDNDDDGNFRLQSTSTVPARGSLNRLHIVPSSAGDGPSPRSSVFRFSVTGQAAAPNMSHLVASPDTVSTAGESSPMKIDTSSSAVGTPPLSARTSVSSPTSTTITAQQQAELQKPTRSLSFLSGWGRRSLSTPTSSQSSSPQRNFSNHDDGTGTLSIISSTNSTESSSRTSPTHALFDEPTPTSFSGVNNGYNSEEESAFILARIEERDRSLGRPGNRESKTMSSFEAFTAGLRLSFATVRDSVTGGDKSTAGNSFGDSGDNAGEDIDWDFWGKVMNNYEDIARKQSRLLTKKLQLGIPESIRGMVWQLMSRGKSPELEATYRALQTRASPQHEKLIQRDLSRTFPKHEHFATVGGSGQESLFNVIKAYSLYDPEVGYCQGIAFIAGPLLLNMPDEEAFCVLVKLMYDYKFRELFTPNMTGLQLRLYQFDKLLEETLPAIAKHLQEQDIRSNMYASQWFMTMFAYRFPLDMVFRIMDIIFAEGLEAMFRFALALMKRNADAILSLDFESLLEFLKIGLFDIYIGNIAMLIQHASGISISKQKLDRMAVEHVEELRRNDPELVTADQLRGEIRRLTESLRRVEAGYETLNKEHIQLAKDHMESVASVERGQLRIEELLLQVDGLKGVLTEERLQAEAVVKEEMDRLARKNLELTAKNSELLDAVDRLELELATERRKTAESEKARMDIQNKWDNLRAALK